MADPSNKTSENYTVVARRYRPTGFSQLIGQSQVATALSNAIQQDRIGHAYLFTGARGVGKTSTARIFAKCLNCGNSSLPTVEPCQGGNQENHCDICRSIESGEDVDVIEIDGASNNGVDNIRELRSNANIRPSRARFKVYIIDEVHMLSKGAFNALLKTLEEPPSHVKFIFCTTEPDKIPITVRSRCQQFDFLPVQTVEIKKRLQEIATNENVQADEAALNLLAQRAKGSMRDSQSLLEQLLSFTTGEITVADVHQLLGSADTAILFEIAEGLIAGQTQLVVSKVAQAVDAGVDAGQLAEQLLGLFRDVMTEKVGCGTEVYLFASPDDQGKLMGLAERLELPQLLSLLQILDRTLVSMRTTTHGRTLLEMACVRICNMESLNGISNLLKLLQSNELDSTKLAASLNAGTSVPTGTSEPASKKNDPPVATQVREVNSHTPAQPPAVAPPASPEPELEQNAQAKASAPPSSDSATMAAEASKGATIEVTEANVGGYWKQTLGQMNDSAAVMASDFKKLAMPKPNQLVVTLTDSYNMDSCNRPEKKSRFETVFSGIVGQPFRIEFEFEATPETERKVEATSVKSRRVVIRELHQHPMMERAMELFDAEIIDFERIQTKKNKPK